MVPSVGFMTAFISGIHADGERRCELCTVCFYGVLETFREAAEQKGKDNAGVASCAAQHGGSRRLCDLSGCFVIRKRLHGVAACTDRHGHIRARVAVRNGEDVEVIHKFPVFQYAVRAGDDCVAKLFTCNHCIHILSKNVRKAKNRLPIDIYMYFQLHYTIVCGKKQGNTAQKSRLAQGETLCAAGEACFSSISNKMQSSLHGPSAKSNRTGILLYLL